MGTLRRKRGEGSVWEQTRADGTNYWRGSVPLLDGSKKYFTAETKEAAEAVRAILLGQARSGHLMRSTPVGKVRDEVSSWIIGRTAGGSSSKGSARKALDPATAQGYKRSLEQLICRPKSGGMR